MAFGAMSAFPGPARSLLGRSWLCPTKVATRRPGAQRHGHSLDGYVPNVPVGSRLSAVNGQGPAGWLPGTASRSRQLSLAVQARLPWSSVMTIS